MTSAEALEAMPRYLMEDPREASRLEEKTDVAETERQLALVGLEPGMTVLDAGAGTGAVARVIARLVGPGGRVVAVDRSEDRLRFGAELARREGLTNLSFARATLEEPPEIERAAFDFVWCRFVIEYVPEPQKLMTGLIERTRVGGKLVAGDVDGAVLSHHPLSPELAEGLATLDRALTRDFDPYSGRKLFHLFRRQPELTAVKAHVLPYNVIAGAITERALANWKQKLAVVRSRVSRDFGGDEGFERFARLFVDQLLHPDTFAYANLVLVEAVRAR